MKCREARQEIALLVGNDLQDAAAREVLKQHVSVCPECRQHYRDLKQSLAALEQADKPSTFEVRESLWPKVSQRLQVRRQQEAAPRPKRWWPMAAVMAACVVLLVLIQPAPQPSPSGVPMERGMFPMSLPNVEQPRPNPPVPPSDKTLPDKPVVQVHPLER